MGIHQPLRPLLVSLLDMGGFRLPSPFPFALSLPLSLSERRDQLLQWRPEVRYLLNLRGCPTFKFTVI